MKITIDSRSGFCFGVVNAINKAENFLQKIPNLYVLGQIVHNDEEVKRLEQKGLKVIDRNQLKTLKNTTVLIRAHGEPPETYQIAYQNNISLIDATCPIVLTLQKRVREAYLMMKQLNGQVVIFGKPNHPEVIGTRGQTNYSAIVIEQPEQIHDKLDFTRPIYLFAQTTKNLQQYFELKNTILNLMKQTLKTDKPPFFWYDSVCRQVAHRDKELQTFCSDKDIIIFVSGKKSSNGRMLFGVCKNVNPRTYFISAVEEIDLSWFNGNEHVGISGATSTPQWLLEKVKAFLEENFA
jgi:4-hydroxy-3-methylbut-2-enyl diphosphate reductase